MDDVIIITHILQESNYQKLHHLLDPHCLQNTNYQITIASSTSITVLRITYFTVVLYVYINSDITLPHTAIVHKPVFISLSNKGYRYTCVCVLVVAKLR